MSHRKKQNWQKQCIKGNLAALLTPCHWTYVIVQIIFSSWMSSQNVLSMLHKIKQTCLQYQAYVTSSGKPGLWRNKNNRLWSDAARSARRLFRAWIFSHMSINRTFFSRFLHNFKQSIHINMEKAWSSKSLLAPLWAKIFPDDVTYLKLSETCQYKYQMMRLEKRAKRS